ncbi:hypothetical protein GCM10020256_22140 [Streptomyces thermocoprophilus]
MPAPVGAGARPGSGAGAGFRAEAGPGFRREAGRGPDAGAGADFGVEADAGAGAAFGRVGGGAPEPESDGADEWCVAGMTAPVRVRRGWADGCGRGGSCLLCREGYPVGYRWSLPTLFGWAIRHFVNYPRVCLHTRLASFHRR